MIAFMRWLCLSLCGAFYRRINVVNAQALPKEGPCIVVANHPNGLLDPMVVNIAVARRVAFLAKCTLFNTMLGRAAMAAFDCIPVYRAKETNTSQNETTFAAASAHLQAGGWLALFPEGISHSAPHLAPLKTGAARIALQSAAPGLQIVPVGLIYEDKTVFRSRVTATVGEPLALAAAPSDARALTGEIARRLRAVVLEADDAQLWAGFRFAARWLGHGGEDVDAAARRYASAYKRLASDAPALAGQLADEVREFGNLLYRAGIEAPFELEQRPKRSAFFCTLFVVVCVAPVALLGALLAWLPYRLVRPVAVAAAHGESDLVSTFKTLLGLVVLVATYSAWALVAGLWRGPLAAVSALLLGPASGYVALRFSEWLGYRRRLLGTVWKRVDIGRLERLRQALAARIASVLPNG